MRYYDFGDPQHLSHPILFDIRKTEYGSNALCNYFRTDLKVCSSRYQYIYLHMSIYVNAYYSPMI